MAAPDPASEVVLELARLGRVLDVGAGTFSLSVARCNSPASRNARIAAIRADRPDVVVVELPRGVLDPLGHAREKTGRESGGPAPRALFLIGLENTLSSDEGDEPTRRTLHALNASRELWPAAFPCPVVFWLPQFAERLLCDRARDLWRWISHFFEFKDEAPAGAERVVPAPSLAYSDALNLDRDHKLARIAELERRLAESEPADDPILMGHRAGWLAELGVLRFSLGELDKAEEHTRKALALNEKLGRLEAMANDHGILGILHGTRGDLENAERHHREALAIHEQLGRLESMAGDYGNLGGLYKTRGELDKAEEHTRKALAINEKLGHLEGVASDHGILGGLYWSRGKLDEAEDHYRKALMIDEKLGRLEGVAVNNGDLGSLSAIRGDLDRAEEHFRKALAIDEKLGRLEGMATHYGNLGILYKRRGELDTAEEHHIKAFAIDEKLGRLEGMASHLANLGILHEIRGDMKSALENWRRARELFRKLGAPHMVEKVQGWIDGAESRAGGGLLRRLWRSLFGSQGGPAPDGGD